MRSVSCKEVSGLECKFVADGKTKEDMKKALEKHGMEKHYDIMKMMSEVDKRKMNEAMKKALDN